MTTHQEPFLDVWTKVICISVCYILLIAFMQRYSQLLSRLTTLGSHVVIVVDRFYAALFSALEQTQNARM